MPGQTCPEVREPRFSRRLEAFLIHTFCTPLRLHALPQFLLVGLLSAIHGICRYGHSTAFSVHSRDPMSLLGCSFGNHNPSAQLRTQVGLERMQRQSAFHSAVFTGFIWPMKSYLPRDPVRHAHRINVSYRPKPSQVPSAAAYHTSTAVDVYHDAVASSDAVLPHPEWSRPLVVLRERSQYRGSTNTMVGSNSSLAFAGTK
jgi:hypothetical protein